MSPRDTRPRVGLFGYLGSGNIGNDASMESVLDYLRSAHPEVAIDAMCTGPARLKVAYGLDAIPLFWYLKHERSDLRGVATRALGKAADIFRIGAWVRRHEVVIVPGMGVLETTLPLRAYGAPYAMFLLGLTGRLFRTKVALVSVGANVVGQPLIRWLFKAVVRLACYVSYRDAVSLSAIGQKGRAGGRAVYPDLAFGIPAGPAGPEDPLTVGVGVMEFGGTNDDRGRAAQIYASYIDAMTRFIVWLADNGRTVRLFVGDSKGCDDRAIDEILAHVRDRRPGLRPDQVTAAPVSSFADLTQVMAPLATIVATRYHNLICALRLGKPTISIGYARKHDALMSDMGLAEYCQHAGTLDVDLLIRQFTDIESRSEALRPRIAERSGALQRGVAEQFSALSVVLFSPTRTTRRWRYAELRQVQRAHLGRPWPHSRRRPHVRQG